MTKPTLPESIMSQSFGLTGDQVTKVEMLGAMLDRAKASGAMAAAAWIDPDGAPHLEAEFAPTIILESES